MNQRRMPISYSELGVQACVGILAGYLLLHPAAMVIVDWLDPNGMYQRRELAGVTILDPFIHAFRFEMLPMGLVFSILCGIVAVLIACQRGTIVRQRNNLREKVKSLDRYRRELERQAARLRKQNDRLIHLEQIKRRNTHFMVHDFKTHLACIQGFAELLLDQATSQSRTDTTLALRRIRRQAYLMMGEVNDLLELARLDETGQLQKQRVDAAPLIREAVADFSLPSHIKQIGIGQSYLNCPPFQGDPRILKRVLTNLISNAFKHNGPATQVQVDARLSDNRSQVIFSCQDNGEGVNPKVKEYLFAEFFSEAGNLNESAGLGLAFCKVAVAAHGGKIWCESEGQGKGSTFYFSIPWNEYID